MARVGQQAVNGTPFAYRNVMPSEEILKVATNGGARLYVREEPGFELDPVSRAARYYQFPQAGAPGPHQFRVGRISRSTP